MAKAESEIYSRFNEIAGGKYSELWNAQTQYYAENKSVL